MAIAELLNTLAQTQLNSNGTQRPGINRSGIKRVSLNTPVGLVSGTSAQPNYTQSLLQQAKDNAQQTYNDNQQVKYSNLAQQIINQSAGNVQTDNFGIVQKPQSNAKQSISSNLGTIGQIGSTALQGAEDKATWQKLLQMQNLNNNYNVSTVFNTNYDSSLIPAGATNNNLGAQAVAIAMTTLKNGTPYRWGGNSLTQGVDCSGLVQQVYAKLGVNLPRTTYEQAKAGQLIKGMQNALPGDLIFYNTGRLDPNGIGKNSHVGIYIGNGKIIEAANSRAGIRISNVDYMSESGTIVRPWS